MILGGKMKVFKRAKKWPFFKGVSPWILQKIELSLIAVFHRNYVRKDLFSIFMKENNYFLTKQLKF